MCEKSRSDASRTSNGSTSTPRVPSKRKIKQISIATRSSKVSRSIADGFVHDACFVAGLELFAQHSTLFTEYLYDDYPEILRCLRTWNAHDNYDVKKIAQRAYDTFLLGVSVDRRDVRHSDVLWDSLRWPMR